MRLKNITWTLWVPVILAFALVIAAWTTIIKIAREHPTQTIQIKHD